MPDTYLVTGFLLPEALTKIFRGFHLLNLDTAVWEEVGIAVRIFVVD